MHRPLRLAPIMLLVLVGGSAGPGPTEVSLSPGTPGYFRSDAYTDAEYLYLDPEGSFSITDVEHMGRFEIDHGVWRTTGDRLDLVSSARVVDVVAPPFRVFVGSQREVTLLPRLKEKVLALQRSHGPGALASTEIEKLAIEVGDGTAQRQISVMLDFEAEYAGTATAADLLALAEAIDTFLAHPSSQNIFSYRAYQYRGQTFLIPLSPGITAVAETPSSVQTEIDQAPDKAPPYVFVAVPKDVFEAGVGRNYPFKFFPELNQPPGGQNRHARRSPSPLMVDQTGG